MYQTKKRNNGFSLIELMVVLALGSIVALALFRIVNQTRLTVQRVEQTAEIDRRLTLVLHQLTRDISAATIPFNADIPAPTSPDTPEKPEEPDSEEPEENKKNSSDNPDAPKKEPKVKKIFYAEPTEDNFKVITFITTSRISAYGQTQPLLARVTYRLQPEKKYKNSFSLTRQERNQLSFSSKESDSIVLATGIKSLIFEYIGGPENSAQQWSSRWPQSIETKDSTGKSKKIKPLLPHFVKIKIELWDNKYKKTYFASTICEIISYTNEYKSPTQASRLKINVAEELQNLAERGKKLGEQKA